MGDRIEPRYRSATGSLSRYRVVVRDVPTGRPGRTISARADVTVRSASDAANTVEARFGDVTFAREEGNPVTSSTPITLRYQLDARRQLAEAPELPEAEGAAELARVIQEDLVLPDRAVAPGETWELPPLTRTLPGGASLSIPRTARYVSTDSEGIATVDVEGTGQSAAFEVGGAQVTPEGRVEQHFRVRAADGALVEAESSTEVQLTAALSDGTAIGTSIDRTRHHLQRLSDATGGAAAHDWRPDVPGGECGAALDAMGRRFAQAPRGIDLDVLVPTDIEPPSRPDRAPIEEPAPILIGDDEASLMAALGTAEVDTALYVLSPRQLSDLDLRRILADVPAFVQIRRLSVAQTVPPSPPRPAGIVALRGQMRRGGLDVWDQTMRALLALCPQASEAYTSALEAEPNARAAQMRDGVHAGIARCGCGVTDMGRLERVMDLRLGPPQLGWAPLQEAPREE